MKEVLSISSPEEQDDLRISPFINKKSLPAPLQQMLKLAVTEQEQDILLMATLTAASACLPNLYFRYGATGKRYYANMQAFILAASASGKGIANQALEMVRVVDEEYPMLIPGDSTLPAWFKRLAEQNGRGYMHESEGSVITDIWHSSAANYNTALRKAAEHEPISRNRCAEELEIRRPQVSMLLTGTFNQYHALVPSVENGYFSRLLTLVERGSNAFDKRYVEADGGKSPVPVKVGKQLLRLYKQLMAMPREQEWSLTAEQKSRLGTHLQAEYPTLMHLLGENFHSVVIRMAIHIERIALVLSALRGNLSTCDDVDYETAELIGNKLLLHMATAYRLIDGDKQDMLPKLTSHNQRKLVFEKLQSSYQLQELISEAKAQGVSRISAIRWNNQWLDEGLISRLSHGKYQKVG